MAEHGAADTTNDQAGGAIVASAIVAIVRAPIDAIVSAQPSRTITTIVAFVIPSRIPVVVARLVASFTAVPSILATIPPVFVAIPALLALGIRGRWRQADE